jgi:formylglycine-generating enzyme required for sulfatase activity
MKKPLLLVVMLLIGICLNVFAQNRGGDLEVVDSNGTVVGRFTNAHALVIGESVYTNGWRRLPGVKEDAVAVKKLFEEQGFNVETIEDANSRNLRNGITNFLDKYGFNPDARIILYFAGHGATLDLSGRRMGYIVPVDAPLPQGNNVAFLQTAIPMTQFETWAKQYTSRHILFIFDSCFAGSVFRTQGATPPAINRLISQPVRQFITSGDADEEVPDESIFRRELEHALRHGAADMNGDGYVSGTELGLYLYDRVSNYMTGRQNPRTGKLNDTNLDKGDFIFATGVTKVANDKLQPPPPPVVAGNVTVTSEIAGEILIDGRATGTTIKEGGTVTVTNVSTGNTEVAVKQANGTIIKAPNMVMVRQGQTVSVQIERPVPANMVRINGGTFAMGSPPSEPQRETNETQHQVTVNSFYMGKYQVTQKEYQEVMGTNPSGFKGDNLPVENVSWYDAVEYCNALSRKEGLTPAYTIDKSRSDSNNKSESDTLRWAVTWNRNANGYRLPTEAEWEYACRAGTTTPFNTGNNITTGNANYDGNYPYNNNAKGTYREKTTAVGSCAPNQWGLYDMHGNVFEWCWDWYGSYASGAQTDPMGASSGSNLVLRGGSGYDNGQYLRSANRSSLTPSYRGSDLGFRLVRPAN